MCGPVEMLNAFLFGDMFRSELRSLATITLSVPPALLLPLSPIAVAIISFNTMLSCSHGLLGDRTGRVPAVAVFPLTFPPLPSPPLVCRHFSVC